MSILILNLSPRRLGTSALLGRLMQEQLGEQTQLWSCLDIEAAWDSFLEAAAGRYMDFYHSLLCERYPGGCSRGTG